MKLRRIILFSFVAPCITALALVAVETEPSDVNKQVNQASQVLPIENNNDNKNNNVVVTPAANEPIGDHGEQVILEAGSPEAEPDEHAAHHEVKLFGCTLGVLGQFGVTVFNFLLFVGILVLVLKGMLSSAFKTHRKEISDKLLKAEQDKNEAERQMHSLEMRMSALQGELDGIMTKSDLDAKNEQHNMVEAAKQEAEQILTQAHANIEAMKKSAEAELRALATELIVNNATKLLATKLHGDTASNAIDQAIEKMRGNQ